MHNQAVLYPQQQHHAASTVCFRDTNSSHQFIWASILNMHPCMSHERQHRRQTSNRMVCCTLHAAISQQPLPREKQHPSQRQTVSAMLATSRPARTVRSTDVKQQKKCFHVKICNTPTKTKTSQSAAGECCCYSIVNEHHDALAIDDTTSCASAVSPPPARPKGSTVQQASPSQTCKHGNVQMSMKQVNRRMPTMLDVAFKNTSNLF